MVGALARDPRDGALTSLCVFACRLLTAQAGTVIGDLKEIAIEIVRAYKTELDPTLDHRRLFVKHVGAARWAYNWGLGEKMKARGSGQLPTAIDLHRKLNGLKKAEFPWLYEVSKCAPQEALRDLDRAFRNHSRIDRRGRRAGFPRFKSRKRGLGSCRLTGSIIVGERSIQLPRVGRVRLKESGYLPTAGVHVLSATISERAGRWFISLNVEQDIPDRAEPRTSRRRRPRARTDRDRLGRDDVPEPADASEIAAETSSRPESALETEARNSEPDTSRSRSCGDLCPDRRRKDRPAAEGHDTPDENQVGDRDRGPECSRYVEEPMPRESRLRGRVPSFSFAPGVQGTLVRRFCGRCEPIVPVVKDLQCLRV